MLGRQLAHVGLSSLSICSSCLPQQSCVFFFNKFIYFFIFGCVGSLLLRAVFSLVVVSGGYSSLQFAGFSLRWLLLLWSTGSRRAGFSSCGTRAQQLWLTGSRAQSQQLWHTGFFAPRHVGSSQTRAQTRVPCTGRRILKHIAPICVSNIEHYENLILINIILSGIHLFL